MAMMTADDASKTAMAGYIEALSKRKDAEIEHVASLVRLREATISHLESVVRLRETELAEAAQLIQQREGVIRQLEQRAFEDDGEVDPKWPTLSLNEKIVACLATIDGWCTPAKAQWLARFIAERRATHVLEIGVFGGKSLIPMALAAQSIGSAVVVGVEPWRADVAVAEPTNEANDDWWTKVDFAGVKSRFFANATRYGVLPTIRILETDSDSALALFERSGEMFDLIHVDGAHSPQRALNDAKSWGRFVKPGGLLVFDDIEWASVQLARAYLKENFRVVDEVIEGEASYGAYEKP